VARSVDVPVISVSEDMAIIAVYRNDEKKPLDPMPRLLARANQALQTLERYKNRLDEVASTLFALEVKDSVTVRDVVTVLQRTEMVRRIAEEIDGYLVELGVDGRLVLLQLEELMGSVEDDRRQIIRDYCDDGRGWNLDQAMAALSELSTEELLDLKSVAALLNLRIESSDLDAGARPRGYRLMSRIPRLPDAVIERIASHFGDLQQIMRATTDDLDDVEGVGNARARAVKAGLSRVAEDTMAEGF
jgi:diadenylate cyclase